MQRTSSTLRASSALLVLLAGCISGGQTGDTDARSGDNYECRPSGVEVELDQALPSGFSARELIASVPEEATSPAVLWSAEAVRSGEERNVWEDAPAATTAVLRARIDSLERAPLYEGSRCLWGDGLALPGTLEIAAQDGSFARALRGHFSGAPGRAFFVEDRPRDVESSFACASSGIVFFPEDSQPSGQACDDAGNVLRFPSTCDGGTPHRGYGTRYDQPSPSEVIESANARGALSIGWSDGNHTELSVALELQPLSTCYHPGDWVAQVRVRADSPSAGIAIDEVVELRVTDRSIAEDDRPIALSNACQHVAEGAGEALRARGDLNDEPGLVCVSIVLNDYEGSRGQVLWISAMDGDAGGDDWMSSWPIEEVP